MTVVLDNLELLVNQECLDAWPRSRCACPRARSSRWPPGQAVAGGGAVAAEGQLLEVGADELAMDEQEARALLEHAGSGWPTPRSPS